LTIGVALTNATTEASSLPRTASEWVRGTITVNLQIAIYTDNGEYDYYIFASPELTPEHDEFKKFATQDERAMIDVSDFFEIEQIDRIKYVDGTNGKRYIITLEEV
jgi:UDP-N-acetylmuramoylalanine-D-glutamate ligase